MIDRISTEVLPNGAIRYAEYDQNEVFAGHRYLKLDDMPLVEGDLIGKQTLLDDNAAAVLGLSGDDAIPSKAFQTLGTLPPDLAAAYGLEGDAAVPNNALSALAFASQYTWVRAQKKKIVLLGAQAIRAVAASANVASTTNVYYVSNLEVDQETGKLFSTDEVSTVALSYNTYTAANVLKGKYWSPMPNFNGDYIIYYTSLNAADATRTSGTTNTVFIDGFLTVAGNGFEQSEVLFDRDPNAYPNGDTDDARYWDMDKFRNLPKTILERTPVSGIVAPPILNTSVNLGFMPTAIVCQQRQPDVIHYTCTFTGLQMGVSQQASNYNNAAWYLQVTPLATGFHIYPYGNTAGVLRYIAFR